MNFELTENEILADGRRFILGQMDNAERERFESQFISNGEMYDLVCVAEEELIEQYIDRKLTAAERNAFESVYLATPAGRRRLDLTRSLSDRNRSTVIEKRSVLDSIVGFFNIQRAVFATGFALIAVVLGGWIFLQRPESEVARVETPKPRTEVSATPTPQMPKNIDRPELPIEENATPPPTPTPTPTPTPKNEVPDVPVPMVALIAGTLRDSGKMTEVVVPVTASSLALRLGLDANNYRSYRIEVVDADGRIVASGKGSRSSNNRLNATIATNRLKTDEYLVKLFGISKAGESESVADYPFRVIRR